MLYCAGGWRRGSFCKAVGSRCSSGQMIFCCGPFGTCLKDTGCQCVTDGLGTTKATIGPSLPPSPPGGLGRWANLLAKVRQLI